MHGMFGRRRRHGDGAAPAALKSNVLEFWPEYSGGPLWSTDGKTVDLAGLALSSHLIERLVAWNSRYDDSKLSLESDDPAWINEGTSLLSEVREALGDAFQVIVTEPWWGEQPC